MSRIRTFGAAVVLAILVVAPHAVASQDDSQDYGSSYQAGYQRGYTDNGGGLRSLPPIPPIPPIPEIGRGSSQDAYDRGLLDGQMVRQKAVRRGRDVLMPERYGRDFSGYGEEQGKGLTDALDFILGLAAKRAAMTKQEALVEQVRQRPGTQIIWQTDPNTGEMIPTIIEQN